MIVSTKLYSKALNKIEWSVVFFINIVCKKVKYRNSLYCHFLQKENWEEKNKGDFSVFIISISNNSLKTIFIN